MTIMMMNKNTDDEIIYNDVMAYDTHGATWQGEKPEPVFQLVFEDETTATFHKNEWDMFTLKR